MQVGRLYSTYWSNLSKNFNFGGPIPHRCTDRGEIWHGGGDLRSPPRAKFHLHRCNVSPLRGEKAQNRPLSNFNTGALHLRNAAGKDREYGSGDMLEMLRCFHGLITVMPSLVAYP